MSKVKVDMYRCKSREYVALLYIVVVPVVVVVVVVRRNGQGESASKKARTVYIPKGTALHRCARQTANRADRRRHTGRQTDR